MQTRKNLMNWMVALAAGVFSFVILITLASAVGVQMGNATGGAANVTATYIVTQLGQAGLSGYLPLIFIAAIAIGILSMMGMGIGGRGKY